MPLNTRVVGTNNFKRVASMLLLAGTLVVSAACGISGGESKQTDDQFAASLRKELPSVRDDMDGDRIRQFGKQLCDELKASGASVLADLVDQMSEANADEDTASQAGTALGKVAKRYCPATAADVFK